MKGKGAKLDVHMNLNLSQTLDMMQNDILDRGNAVMRYISFNAAQTLLEEVTAKIPNLPEYDAYKRALKVVQSGSPENPVFSVAGESQAQPVEAKKDIILFKPKKVGGRIDPIVAVLVANQPWTADTLPFQPPTKHATMQTRQVTADEVKRVEKARNTTRQTWERDLQKLGVRPKPKAEMETMEATPDIMYTALRLEFGLGRTKAVAHWRPAVRTTLDRVNEMFASKKVSRAMTDWKFTEWRKWRTLGAETVSTSDLKGSAEFQSKVTR